MPQDDSSYFFLKFYLLNLFIDIDIYLYAGYILHKIIAGQDRAF